MAIVWLEDNPYTVSDWFEELSDTQEINLCFEPNRAVKALESGNYDALIIDIMLLAGTADIDPNVRGYFEKNDLGTTTEFSGIAVAHWALETFSNLEVLILTVLPDIANAFKDRLDDNLADRLSVLSKHEEGLKIADIQNALKAKK